MKCVVPRVLAALLCCTVPAHAFPVPVDVGSPDDVDSITSFLYPAAVTLTAYGAQAAPAQVGTPSLTPTQVGVGTPTTVQVTSVITDARVIPGSVFVQQVNGAGRVTILGTLRDDGNAPDAVAGDRSFTGTVVVTATSVGSLRIRVSAALRGVVLRASSPLADISVVGSDTTPPTITASVSPRPNPAGWHRTPVRVKFACKDADSGVATCPQPIVVSADGAHVVSGVAIDRASNSATATVAVSVDRTPPSIQVQLSPAPGPSGVYAPPVTARFVCSDGGSGVASCPPEQVLQTSGPNQTVSGTAIDRAGNVHPVTSAPFTIDSALQQLRPVAIAVQPQSIGSGIPTVLTVTATPPTGADLVPGSVQLARHNATGALLAILGAMFDDGTHGDAIPFDGTFTTTVTFVETGPGPLLLRVSAVFSTEPVAGGSRPVLVPIVVVDSAPNARAQLAGNLRGGNREAAYQRLGVTFNSGRLLEPLDTASLGQVADALDKCSITAAGEGFEFCEASSMFRGEIIEFDFFLFRDVYGVWRIISW